MLTKFLAKYLHSTDKSSPWIEENPLDRNQETTLLHSENYTHPEASDSDQRIQGASTDWTDFNQFSAIRL